VSLRALPIALAGAALLLEGCPKPAPVVRQQRFSATPEATQLVAIVPFYPRPTLTRSSGEGGVSPDEAASLVTRFVTEALAGQGFAVVPAVDVEVAFTGSGVPVPRLDPRASATLAAREFGATGVLLGEVLRYRERGGAAYGTSRPASVSFLVTLYQAPTGERLWRGQFDETQQALGANVLNAPRYPGGGTRWLTAGELARWGAGEIATTLRAAH